MVDIQIGDISPVFGDDLHFCKNCHSLFKAYHVLFTFIPTPFWITPSRTDSQQQRVFCGKDPKNIKALYRRAQGALGANDFEVAVKDCKRILELEPENKDTGPVGGSDRSHLKWCDTNGVKTSKQVNLWSHWKDWKYHTYDLVSSPGDSC